MTTAPAEIAETLADHAQRLGLYAGLATQLVQAIETLHERIDLLRARVDLLRQASPAPDPSVPPCSLCAERCQFCAGPDQPDQPEHPQKV